MKQLTPTEAAVLRCAHAVHPRLPQRDVARLYARKRQAAPWFEVRGTQEWHDERGPYMNARAEARP